MAIDIFVIDVVGGCNLRCPTCPVGNSNYEETPKGVMRVDVFEKIIEKAVRECGKPKIALYNWTEPFLHPRLHELVAIVNKHNLKCTISTNLNVMRNVEVVCCPP